MSEPDNTPLPALTQPEREAVFDFLLLATYADSSLRLRENERLYEIVSGLGWESYQEPAAYADLATARVRAASESSAGTADCLGQLAARLTSPGAKTFALAVLPRLLDADGAIDESEESFYAQAKAAFGV